MSIELKIKSKHLASEAKIIRKEEQRLNNIIINSIKRGENNEKKIEDLRRMQCSIADHRKSVVRDVRRSTHLAYNYLRGNSYKSVENTSRTNPNLKEIVRMVTKYSDNNKLEVTDKINEWVH